MNTLHVKKGDTVKIIAGKDKGKTGKILRAFPQLATVLVEGMNMKTKHIRPKRSNEKGQVVQVSSPIHVSNVAKTEVKKKTTKTTKAKAK